MKLSKNQSKKKLETVEMRNEQRVKQINKDIKIKEILKYVIDIIKDKKDLDSVIESSVEGIKKILHFDRVRLYLLSDLKTELIGKYTTGKYVQQEDFKRIKIKIKNDEVIRDVIFNKKTKIFAPFHQDPLAKKLRKDKKTKFIAAPITNEENTIGMITADNKISKKKIDEEQISLLSIFSQQIALTIENIRTKEDYKKRLSDFNNIIEIASTLNKSNSLSEILDSVVIRLVKRYNISECEIFLLSKNKDKLKLMSSFFQVNNIDKDKILDVNKAKTYQRTIKQKKIQYIENLSKISEHKDRILFDMRKRSFISIPILMDNKIYGIISFKTTKITHFDRNDYNYWYGVSNQAAIAIKNAILYDTLTQKINESKLLNKINNSITRVTDILETIDTLKTHLQKHHLAKVNVLFVSDKNIIEKGKEYKIIMGDVFYSLIRHKKIKIIEDSEKYNYRRINKKSVVLIPLYEEKKCKAILEIIERKITSEKRDFYKNLDEVLKVANHSKKLYDDIKNKNKELEQVNLKLDDKVKTLNLIQKLSTKLSNIKEPNKIIEIFFNHIKFLYPQEKVCIGFVDNVYPIFSDEGYNVNKIIDTIDTDKNKTKDVKIGISGEALKKSKPIICNDISKNSNYIQFFKKVKSQISLPILIRKKPIGFVTIESFEKDKFTDKDKIDTLKVLIEQVMINLDNAALVHNLEKNSESLKKKIKEIYTLGNIIKSINKTDKIEKILEVANNSIVYELGFVCSQIKLFNKTTTDFIISKKTISKDLKKIIGNKDTCPRRIDKIIATTIKNNPTFVKKDFINLTEILTNSDERKLVFLDKINKMVFFLKDQDKFLGVIIVGILHPTKFNKSSMNTFYDIANQIVIATKDSRLIKEIKNFGQRMKNEVNKKTKELKITNDILRKERNRIRNTIDLMADSLIVSDNSEKITMVNNAFEQMTGLKREDIKNKNIYQVLRTLGAKKNVQKAHLEEELYLEKINKYVNVKKTDLLEKEKDIGDIFIIQDITKIKEVNKLKTEFVSNVSHELRTPLTSILGYTKLLFSERLGSLENNQKESLKIINDEAERLTRLINDVLDISKLEAGKLSFDYKTNDIKKLVHEVKNNFFALAQQSHINFSTRISKNVTTTAIFDYDRIKQVFINLVNNAFKFTPENGSVIISVKQNKGKLICNVSDTGEGIDKEHINNLFNKFYQVDSSMTRKQGGSGLGLAISKDIVEKHNGTINVQSKIGKGSVFSFEFPIIANKK